MKDAVVVVMMTRVFSRVCCCFCWCLFCALELWASVTNPLWQVYFCVALVLWFSLCSFSIVVVDGKWSKKWSNHFWPSLTIFDHFWPSLTIFDHLSAERWSISNFWPLLASLTVSQSRKKLRKLRCIYMSSPVYLQKARSPETISNFAGGHSRNENPTSFER